jgi:hypothetical protein
LAFSAQWAIKLFGYFSTMAIKSFGFFGTMGNNFILGDIYEKI